MPMHYRKLLLRHQSLLPRHLTFYKFTSNSVFFPLNNAKVAKYISSRPSFSFSLFIYFCLPVYKNLLFPWIFVNGNLMFCLLYCSSPSKLPVTFFQKLTFRVRWNFSPLSTPFYWPFTLKRFLISTILKIPSSIKHVYKVTNLNVTKDT